MDSLTPLLEQAFLQPSDLLSYTKQTGFILVLAGWALPAICRIDGVRDYSSGTKFA